MHFFSPANVMKLLEVVRGEKTAKDVLATVMQLGKKIKKTCVVSGVCDGFIGNRMIEQYSRQAGFLLEEGARPQQVDKALEKFGFAMGPFRMGDLAGNDIGWYIRKRRYVEKPEPALQQDRRPAVRAGPLRPEDRRRLVRLRARQARRDPVQAWSSEMIAEHRDDLGITPRKISDEEIVQRLRLRAGQRGRAASSRKASRCAPRDIDMVYLTGYGFPLYRGGPMCYADTVGLFNVVQAMKRFAAEPARRRRRSGSRRRCSRGWPPKARPSAETRRSPRHERPRHLHPHGRKHRGRLAQDRRRVRAVREGAARPADRAPEAARGRLRRLPGRPLHALAADRHARAARRPRRGVRGLRAAARHRRHAGAVQPLRRRRGHPQAGRQRSEPLDGAAPRHLPGLLLLPPPRAGPQPARPVRRPPALRAHRRVLRALRQPGLRPEGRDAADRRVRADAAARLRAAPQQHLQGGDAAAA